MFLGIILANSHEAQFRGRSNLIKWLAQGQEMEIGKAKNLNLAQISDQRLLTSEQVSWNIINASGKIAAFQPQNKLAVLGCEELEVQVGSRLPNGSMY